MRPRGTPPIPMAASSDSDVVEIAGTSETSRSPRRMIDPLPKRFSILSSAASMARLRSAILSSDMGISFFCSSSQTACVVDRGRSDTVTITQLTREWNRVSHMQHGLFGEGGSVKTARFGSPLCHPDGGVRARAELSKIQHCRASILQSRPLGRCLDFIYQRCGKLTNFTDHVGITGVLLNHLDNR